MRKHLKKTVLLLFALAFLLQFAFALPADDAVVTRVIKDYVKPGQTVEIEISISLEGDPSSLIVTEIVPSGWEVINSTPKASNFDGKIKWLLYGANLKDGAKLKYTLKAPANFSKSQVLEGNWKTLDSAGLIEGDAVINEKIESEPITPAENKPVAAEDNNFLMIVVIIIVAIIIVAAIVLTRKKK